MGPLSWNRLLVEIRLKLPVLNCSSKDISMIKNSLLGYCRFLVVFFDFEIHLSWYTVLFMVCLHCPTPVQTQRPRQRKTLINLTRKLVGICLDVCFCAVWILPHNSLQPIFYLFLCQSRVSASVNTPLGSSKPFKDIVRSITKTYRQGLLFTCW